MSENVTKMGRTGGRPTRAVLRRAAALCFRDELPDVEIAAELGVCRRTLARWKHRPEFEAAYTAWYRAEVKRTDRKRNCRIHDRLDWRTGGAV